MSVLAKFDVIDSKGAIKTVEFVTHTDPTKCWQLDGMTMAQPKSFRLRGWRVFHLKDGEKFVGCPGGAADWWLVVRPAKGDGTATVCVPRLSDSLIPKHDPKKAFVPQQMSFVFTGHGGANSRSTMESSSGLGPMTKKLVEWQLAESVPVATIDVSDAPFSVETRVLHVFPPPPSPKKDIIFGQLVAQPAIPGQSVDASRHVIELRLELQNTSPDGDWSLHRPELSRAITISWAADSVDTTGRVRWRLTQTIRDGTKAFLDLWSTVVQPYHDAFAPIRDGHQESVVPVLGKAVTTGTDAAELKYLVSLPAEFCQWDEVNNCFRGAESTACRLHLESWLPPTTMQDGSGATNLPMTLPKFRRTTGEALTLTIGRARVEKSQASPNDEDPAEVARLVLRERIQVTPADSGELRDGALSLALTDEWPPGTTKATDGSAIKLGVLRIRAQHPGNGDPWWVMASFAPEAAFFTGARLSPVVEALLLPVAAVRPGGQDAVPGDDYIAPHRAARLPASQLPSLAPVIVPLGDAPTSRDANYVLSCTEQSGWQRSATLELELNQLGTQTTAAGEVLVLDTAPFGVMRVKHEPLSIANAAEMTLLARRSTGAEHGASWELRDVDGDLTITLPPQGVGEAMEKAETKPDGTPLVDIEEGRLVDFRLTPGARLTLAASYFAKRYVEVPWNTRRQFGWAGQRDPGASLRKLEFELLYGLSCEVTKPWLRLADLLARTGALPRLPAEALAWTGTKEQNDQFEGWSKRQQALALAIRSRLGVLEVWDQRQPEGLKIKDGIEFFPRVERDQDNAPWGAQLRFPLTTHDPEDEILPVIEKMLHNKDGLAGGFSWAFESGNIYKEFWRNPRSSSAALEGLWFSALGGWAHQTARFAADKTVLESRFSMGRKHFHVLERIGRIGVFWNKAKHVILYERVTGRTRQFGNQSDGPGVYQDAHAGRPILRKVREYVELLEPERFYPDFPGDEPTHCGFVTGCVFRSKIMPVKSTWGRDVKAFGAPVSGAAQVVREGWEIPLWQEGSDSITYPKPQIELEVITDPDAGEAGKLRVMLEQPQRLYFFTETTLGTTADVHAWNPFPWTDYCDLPEPEIFQSEKDSLSPSAPDAPLPDAEDELPGYERFTFAITAGAPQVNVTARRVAEAGLSATLRNVTMMRAAPNGHETEPTVEPLKTAWKAQRAITGARAKLADAADGNVAAIRELIERKTATEIVVRNRLTDWLTGAFSGEIATVQALGTALIPPGGGLQCAAAPAFPPLSVGEWLWKQADHQAFRFHQFVTHQVIAPPFNKLIVALDEAEKLNSSTKEKLVADIEQARVTVRKTWRGFQGVLDTGLKAPHDAARRFFDQFRSEFMRLSSFPDAWLADVEAAVRRDSGTAQAAVQKWLTDKRAEFTAFVAHVRRFLDKSQLTANRLAKAANPPSWLSDPVNGITQGIGKLNQMVTAFETAIVQLFSEADAAALNVSTAPQLLLDKLALLRGELRKARLKLADEMARQTTAWEREFDKWLRATIQNDIEGAERDISSFVNVLDELLSKLRDDVSDILPEDWGAKIKALKAAFSQRRDDIVKLGNPHGELQQELCDFLTTHVVPKIRAFDSMLDLQSWKQQLDQLKDWFADEATLAANVLGRVESVQRLYEAINHVPPDFDAARRELDQVLKDAGTEFRSAAGEVLAHSRQIYEKADAVTGAVTALQQEASRTLRSVRALCDSLTAPGLGFNRKTVALFYQARGTVIGMTPCIAKMRELGDQLQSLGLRLPTAEISERLKGLREKLPDFNFGTILADLGLDFSDMFPGFKMPADFDDYLKLSHDVDEQQMRAWARAELDYRLPGRKTLFSIGPIEVTLNQAHVEGRASIEAELERPVKKSTWARMTGNWEVTIGGTQLVTFVDAEVVMDNGRMDFKLQPQKIVMSSAMKMLTDLTEGMNALFGDSGFTLGFVKEGMIPVGLRAVLELPCFDAAGATSGVTGLQLGASFELRALDENLQLNFSIGAGFHLGRKDKPFNVLIFILGGGGWVETDIYYRPKGGEITVRVSIGLQVSASLALNFGVVRGAVGVYLGIFADYTKRTGQSGSLQVGIMLLFRGEVDVLGIISVMLSLLLEVVYLSDGQKKTFYGRGTLSLEIRICWCFKIKVRKSVTYNFGGLPGGGGGGPVPHAMPAGNTAALAQPVGGAPALPAAPAPAAPAVQRTNYQAAAAHYVDYLL